MDGDFVSNEIIVEYTDAGCKIINSDEMEDADGDGLPDILEIELGTRPDVYDTDGDGLGDGIEVFELNTMPTIYDTDEDGLSDGAEYELGSDPNDADSDQDGLEDGFEVNEFNTLLTKYNTDEDGLNDGDEYVLGTDPNSIDSDGDGIIDSEEIYEQILEKEIESPVKAEVTDVSVSFGSNQNIQNKVTIVDTYGDNSIVSNVVGLVGVPVSFETEVDFETATIEFTYDEAAIGEISEEDLGILWYNESEGVFELLDTEVDTANNLVKVETEHFSEYMLVDKQAWTDVWSQELTYDTDEEISTIDTDGDGIYDVIEEAGIRLQNGQIVYCDPNNPDTDGDGLLDGEEIGERKEYTFTKEKVVMMRSYRMYLSHMSALEIEEGGIGEGIDYTYAKEIEIENSGYYEIKSNPLERDSDRDGYPDEEDLDPNHYFMHPIILIHGRNSNTESAYGVITHIPDEANNHYKAEESISEYKSAEESINGLLYKEFTSHEIKEIEPNGVGEYIEKMHYRRNENLFAFNYPNQDFNQFNAYKFAAYVKDLKDTAILKDSQSPALKGQSSITTSTFYLGIGGYDWRSSQIYDPEIEHPSLIDLNVEIMPKNLLGEVFSFELFPGLYEEKEEIFLRKIRWTGNMYYPDLYLYPDEERGDNVVELLSQFGYDKELENRVCLQRTALVVDTKKGHWAKNSFHNAILWEKETHKWIKEYIEGYPMLVD